MSLTNEHKKALAKLVKRRITRPKLLNDKPMLTAANVPQTQDKLVAVAPTEILAYALKKQRLCVVLTDGYKCHAELTDDALTSVQNALGLSGSGNA